MSSITLPYRVCTVITILISSYSVCIQIMFTVITILVSSYSVCIQMMFTVITCSTQLTHFHYVLPIKVTVNKLETCEMHAVINSLRKQLLLMHSGTSKNGLPLLQKPLQCRQESTVPNCIALYYNCYKETSVLRTPPK